LQKEKKSYCRTFRDQEVTTATKQSADHISSFWIHINIWNKNCCYAFGSRHQAMFLNARICVLLLHWQGSNITKNFTRNIWKHNFMYKESAGKLLRFQKKLFSTVHITVL